MKIFKFFFKLLWLCFPLAIFQVFADKSLNLYTGIIVIFAMLNYIITIFFFFGEIKARNKRLEFLQGKIMTLKRDLNIDYDYTKDKDLDQDIIIHSGPDWLRYR